MFNQRKRDNDRIDVINYIIEKVGKDVESGESRPYVANILDEKIDIINAIYDNVKKYGIGSLVSAITSVVSLPATMFLTNNVEDFKGGMAVFLLSASASVILQILKNWAKKDARILESDVIKMFVQREYVKEEEMPEDIYKKYKDPDIYESREY